MLQLKLQIKYKVNICIFKTKKETEKKIKEMET